MTEQHTFTDEDLTAYLDDEADSALYDAIHAARKTDHEVQTRLDNLTIDKDQITAAFDSYLDHAPASVELPEVKTQGGLDPTLYKMAVAALVALVVGVSVGTKFSQDAKLDGWRGYVAAYHALYNEQTLASIDPTGPGPIDELQRAAQLIGKNISVDDLQSSDLLAFKRTQILSFKGNPLVQLTFVTADGAPVALCIIKKPDLADSQPRTAILEGMPATSWSKGGYDYILIGSADSKLIEKAATVYANKI